MEQSTPPKKISGFNTWVLVLVAIIAGAVLGGLGYWYGTSKQKATVPTVTPVAVVSKTSVVSPTVTSTTEQIPTDVREVVDNFEEYQKNHDTKNVLALFSPAQSESENEGYNSLIDRLYSANELSYDVLSWKISDIKKIGENKYEVKVTEYSNANWNNAQEPVGWTNKDKPFERRFVITKQDSRFLIKSYISDSSPKSNTDAYSEKYSGFFR